MSFPRSTSATTSHSTTDTATTDFHDHAQDETSLDSLSPQTQSGSAFEHVQIEDSWKNHLLDEFKSDYMFKLKNFLVRELRAKKTIFPHGKNIFKALELTPFNKVKVVIIGQDPYHGVGQAHGLCFSVLKGVAVPPSLQNIYKELRDDLGVPIPRHGNLTSWAEQGVLLLNTTLTVEKGKPQSHQNQGWEIFTDKIIEILNREKNGLIFILWGSPAQKKGSKIDVSKHFILKAPHPSPLSAHRGFFGKKYFSQANFYLKQQGLEPINWQID